MARPYECSWTRDVSDKLMSAAQGTKCPISGGHETILTEGAATMVCERNRKKGVQIIGGRDVYGSYNAGDFRPYHACKDCKGPKSRKEIKIIYQKEAAKMGGR